jgi:hypothetical protein
MRTGLVTVCVAALLLVLQLAGQQPPEHWAFRPIVGSDDSIDGHLRARLERAGLALSPPADRRTLVRRLHLTLHGLPPAPDVVARCEESTDADWYERLVDELLASPRYGERQARHWLDVVRYADTHGFETNTPRPNAYHYRDWVIDAFNRDLPWDRFVLEQLAGDAVGRDAATGFLVAGPQDSVKSPDPALTAQQRADELADIVNATSTAFLGLTVACARCHDHKFDPIRQREYYAMEAVFAGVQHGERALRPADPQAHAARAAAIEAKLTALDRRLAPLEPLASLAPGGGRRPPVHALFTSDRFAPRLAAGVRLTIEATAGGDEPCIDEIEVFTVAGARNVAAASEGAVASASSEYPNAAIHKIVHLNDGRIGNSWSWISNEPGKGMIEIRLREPAVVERVVWSRDRLGRFADRLAVRYRIEVATTTGGWREVANSDDRATDAQSGCDERHELLRERAALHEQVHVYAGTFTEPEPTRRLHRGDPLQPREPVAPGALAALGALELPAGAPEQERRIALARWITGPAAPLTARVVTNRLWHHCFGTGLVATPSDFGRNGAPPSHPELLDHLAGELIASGWSIKHVQRLIVGSATFRQSSAPCPQAAAVDADARLLWRFPPRRLEAEAIRDAILHAAGSLDLTPGGPGFDVFEPDDNYVRVYRPKRAFGPAEWRRAVYAHVVRMERDETFGVFDCPDGGQPAPRRSTSTTAIQALALQNSTFVVEQCERFAARLRAEAGDVPDALVARAFAIAFQRAPDRDEHRAAVALVAQHGLAALCRALFNSNEFVFLP